ncbi:MAG: hypothetical protein KGL75_13860 [Acidobacteriota bacterium]|nr:hypothetical protein [Acidobacteriota bacterium]
MSTPMNTPSNTMDCGEFAEQIEEWLRGQRSVAARLHARECAGCRGMAEDFGAIANVSREWSLEDAQPSPRLWHAIRAQLQEEGLIRDAERPAITAAPRPQPRLQASRPGAWLTGWFAGALRPALAGGYLAIIIALAVLFVGPSGKQIDDSQWLARTQRSVRPLNSELDSAEHIVVSNLASASPVVAASLHQNLAIVDNDIALCEKSVRDDPENELARDYLYQAYEQKADLLVQMADRGVGQ